MVGAVGVELWKKACDGTGGDVQTREAETVEAEVTASEAKEREEIMSQKERPPPARLSVVCGSSALLCVRRCCGKRRCCVCVCAVCRRGEAADAVCENET